MQWGIASLPFWTNLSMTLLAIYPSPDPRGAFKVFYDLTGSSGRAGFAAVGLQQWSKVVSLESSLGGHVRGQIKRFVSDIARRVLCICRLQSIDELCGHDLPMNTRLVRIPARSSPPKRCHGYTGCLCHDHAAIPFITAVARKPLDTYCRTLRLRPDVLCCVFSRQSL